MGIRLHFGTAGIRAPLGDADDQLNVRTVRGVAQALAEYVFHTVPDARARGLCVGYDGRNHSDSFAREVCSVALAHGLCVRAFDTPVPTPLLAFATRQRNAALGVMITASHNPKDDNGIKVFWEGGAQILAPHDEAVAQRILAIEAPEHVARANLDEARRTGQLSSIDDSVTAAYLDAVVALVPSAPEGVSPRIAYTALCGVGSPLTHRLFERLGVRDWVEVASQAAPRADFGGLSSPNPEHLPALAELLALAEREQAEVAFAHDPDADRLAMAVREPDGSMAVLTGDQVGALLGGFLLESYRGAAPPLVISTFVSADLLGAMAQARGARFEQTLTGFKHIVSRARALERDESLCFVFGYEEAIGYGFGALGDDKDGFAALALAIELVRRLKARGSSVRGELERLAQTFGLYATRQLTVRAEPERMLALTQRARTLDARALLGPSATLTDFAARPERADLVILRDVAGNRVCIRPSGTEPKIKFYLQTRCDVGAHERAADAQARADAVLDALESKLKAHFA